MPHQPDARALFGSRGSSPTVTVESTIESTHSFRPRGTQPGDRRGQRTERAIRIGEQSKLAGWLLASIVLGFIFVGLQVTEWLNKPFSISSHAFGSLYYVITGFHMAHVAVGLIMLIAVLIWAWRGDFAPGRHLAVTTTSYYWHFVDVVWISVFFSFYLWPRLI